MVKKSIISILLLLLILVNFVPQNILASSDEPQVAPGMYDSTAPNDLQPTQDDFVWIGADPNKSFGIIYASNISLSKEFQQFMLATGTNIASNLMSLAIGGEYSDTKNNIILGFQADKKGMAYYKSTFDGTNLTVAQVKANPRFKSSTGGYWTFSSSDTATNANVFSERLFNTTTEQSDLFLIRHKEDGTGTVSNVFLLKRDGGDLATGPNYIVYNLTASLANILKPIGWDSNAIAIFSTHKDTGVVLPKGTARDLAVVNCDGKVIRLLNNGSGSLTATTILTDNDFKISGKVGNPSIGIADFNGDGIPDIVLASTEHTGVKIYYGYKEGGTIKYSTSSDHSSWVFNKGTSGTTVGINTPGTGDGFVGSASTLLITDFNNDGKPDIIIGTDKHRPSSSSSHGGFIYSFINNGMEDGKVKFASTKHKGYTSSWQDNDVGAVADFNFDGYKDFSIGDGNDSGAFGIFLNKTTEFYFALGRAVSPNLITLKTGNSGYTYDNFDDQKYKIEYVKLDVTHNVPTGTAIQYFVATNVDGSGLPVWQDITAYVNTKTQVSAGTKLMWRADLYADNVKLTTPSITKVLVTYWVSGSEIKIRAWRQIR